MSIASLNTPIKTFNPREALKVYAKVAELDPLGIDAIVHKLPELNKTENVVEMLAILNQMAKALRPDVSTYTFEEAMAILRDLGIPLGSIKKQGIEPVEAIPGLGKKLVTLGEITNLPPRNTIFSYCMCNPSGVRERKYTATPDESRLLDSIRMAMPDLEEAIINLHKLYDISVSSEEFAPLCNKIEAQYSKMVEATVFAHKYISPKVFAQEIRFYYDPVIIEGKPYMGPGAVEMPSFIFDHILWSNECEENFYKEFKNTYIPYVLQYFRDLYQHYNGQPSLISKIEEELNSLTVISDTAKRSVKALMNIINVLISFRTPHKKLAERSYAESSDGPREKGSGGYHPNILTQILDLTLESRSRYREILMKKGITA